MKNIETSWESVASWYDKLYTHEDSYQKKVILPNLLRMMEIQKTDTILDIACGQGFFAGAFVVAGGEVVWGNDVSPSLIKRAEKAVPKGKFFVAPGDDLSFAQNTMFSKITIILALQNIQKLNETLKEAARVLKKGGKLYVVLNHPAFRIPKRSEWGFDEKNKIQYRRLDGYMSERSEKIMMHPGKAKNPTTITFHRPLQVYFKSFRAAGFSVVRLEEWVSHKKSEKGPRAKEEDTARKEFPLFMAFELALR